MNTSKTQQEREADKIVEKLMAMPSPQREAMATGLERFLNGQSPDEAFGEFVPDVLPQEVLTAARDSKKPNQQ